jgi:hypothetical protein
VQKPGGHFLFNVWDRIADNEFADVVTDALATRFPNDPPRFMARVPHGYADTDLIRADVAAAGFSSVAVETVTHASRARSASDVALAYCQGSPLRNEIEARPGSPLEEATELAAEALRRRYGDGPIEGRIQAHVFRATR